MYLGWKDEFRIHLQLFLKVYWANANFVVQKKIKFQLADRTIIFTMTFRIRKEIMVNLGRGADESQRKLVMSLRDRSDHSGMVNHDG